MSTAQHTPGPWRQGLTLRTAQTSRWTAEEIAANDARERRMVFARFTGMDEGTGRVRIAVCEREEDARLIAAAPDLLRCLKWMVGLYEAQARPGLVSGVEYCSALNAIARATGDAAA